MLWSNLVTLCVNTRPSGQYLDPLQILPIVHTEGACVRNTVEVCKAIQVLLSFVKPHQRRNVQKYEHHNGHRHHHTLHFVEGSSPMFGVQLRPKLQVLHKYETEEYPKQKSTNMSEVVKDRKQHAEDQGYQQDGRHDSNVPPHTLQNGALHDNKDEYVSYDAKNT